MSYSNDLFTNSCESILVKVESFLNKSNTSYKSSELQIAFELFVNCVDNFTHFNGSEELIFATRDIVYYIQTIIPSIKFENVLEFTDGFIKWIKHKHVVEIKNVDVYRLEFGYSFLNRNIFSLMFNILDSLKKVERIELERMFFTKYLEEVKSTFTKLKLSIDYEEKISLLELYWRGLRRIDINDIKASRTFKNLIKEISAIESKNFEFKCNNLLIKRKFISPANGYFPCDGIIELLETNQLQISNYKIKELYFSYSSIRIHVSFYNKFEQIDSTDGSCNKIEVPNYHINDFKIDESNITFSIQIVSFNFDVTSLWSEQISNMVKRVTNNKMVIKIRIMSEISREMRTMAKKIINVLGENNELEPKGCGTEMKTEEIIEIRDETEEILFSSNSDDREIVELLNMAKDQYNKIKVTQDPDIVDDHDNLVDKDLFTQESFVENIDIRGSWIEPFNKISLESAMKCEIPKTIEISKDSKIFPTVIGSNDTEKSFYESQECCESTPSTLRSSDKSSLAMSSEVRISGDEYINRFDTSSMYTEKYNEPLMEQAERRKRDEEKYKAILIRMSNEIEKENKELETNARKILGELEKLESKYTFNRKIEETNKSSNILIEKSSELVKKTEETLKGMERIIEKIIKHYQKRTEDCEKALKSIYVK
ncbi:uncharacterized protein TA08660 [Theileria annulata]|uniref:Uncharacterized protein n=1 Tax=Theileria annulata TaxID=5874 RepID=Q4U9I6_THEAN|nr:uncharacterized protein TA08660 [Theileria annulata]CAI76517.1 hypothetical protein TA08660 [Theileria annulata]|eukprot:XP_953142.1 hypothetical protein TA08660 [Theileria annulata]